MWAGLIARSIRAAGGRPGMTVHISYNYACSPAASAAITAPNGSA